MSDPGEVKGKEVCVVDDDLSVLKSMYYLLASAGLKVRTFNRPEDFLAHAGTHHVQVAVVDIWMDRITGLEVLARLCAISPKTHVIVVTASEDLAAHATAKAIGPFAFFMKPFDDEKFISAVRVALKQNRKKADKMRPFSPIQRPGGRRSAAAPLIGKPLRHQTRETRTAFLPTP